MTNYTVPEFISLATSFPAGTLMVLVCPDHDTSASLLSGIQTIMPVPTVLHDTTSTERHLNRLPTQCGARVPEDCSSDLIQEGLPWEGRISIANGSIVTLVSHDYPPTNNTLLTNGKDLTIDVIADLISTWNVNSIPETMSTRFAVRELYPFITDIFYYDTTAAIIHYLDHRNPERPFSPLNPPTLKSIKALDGSNQGPANCEQILLLVGDDFYPGAKVCFNGREAVPSRIDSRTIYVMTGRQLPGYSNIEIHNPDGSFSYLQSGFYFVG